MYLERTVIQKPPKWEKPPTSIGTQIELLKKKGLSVDGEDEAGNFLSRVNYCRAKEYAKTLAGSNGDLSGITLRQLEEFYGLDRNARTSILAALSEVEVFFRTELAYIVSTDTNDPFWYLEPANFLNKDLFAKTLDELECDLKKNWVGKQPNGTSWPRNVVALPAWEMVEVVSFGKLSKIFSNLKKVKFIGKVGNRLGFGKEYAKSVVRAFVCLRNRCAHHERILGTRFSIYPPKIPSMENFGFDNQLLGGFVFCIARALSSNKDLHDSFVRQMKNLQKKFPSSILIGLGFGDMDKL